MVNASELSIPFEVVSEGCRWVAMVISVCSAMVMVERESLVLGPRVMSGDRVECFGSGIVVLWEEVTSV